MFKTPAQMVLVESRGLLETPERVNNIPDSAQWLGGVGAGSWFVLHHDNSMGKYQYRVQRFSMSGELECDALFYLEDAIIDMNKPYHFSYLSHCEKCTILQGEQKFVLEVIYYPADR